VHDLIFIDQPLCEKLLAKWLAIFVDLSKSTKEKLIGLFYFSRKKFVTNTKY